MKYSINSNKTPLHYSAIHHTLACGPTLILHFIHSQLVLIGLFIPFLPHLLLPCAPKGNTNQQDSSKVLEDYLPDIVSAQFLYLPPEADGTLIDSKRFESNN